MGYGRTGHIYPDTQTQQQDPGQHDVGCAETPDQLPGEKRWNEHPKHMPLNNKGGLRKRMRITLHGKRGGDHNEIHDAIADHGAGDCNEIGRLAGDGCQRPSALCS